MIVTVILVAIMMMCFIVASLMTAIAFVAEDNGGSSFSFGWMMFTIATLVALGLNIGMRL